MLFFILESVRDVGGQIIDFRFVFLNDNGAKLLSSTTQNLQGQLLCECFPINRTDGFFDKYKRVVETGEHLIDEFPIDARPINASWLRYQVIKLDDGVAITTTNISAIKEEELKLAKLAAFKRSIVNSSPFATIVTDLHGTITSFNPAAERMLWYRKEHLVELETPLVLLDSQDLAKRAAILSDELHIRVEPGIAVLKAKPQRGLVEEAEWKLIRRDGSRFDAQLTVSALTDTAGHITGLILIAYDITERKRANEYISHIAHHDALTGLPTRTLLQDRVGVALARASRYGHQVGVLMVDLDNFKKINDLMGHHVGDGLLTIVAKRVQSSAHISDTVARMGGDEFVILLDELSTVQEAERIAEKLLQELATPISIGANVISVTASIGICVYPENAHNAEALLNNADTAMYQAKAEGRSKYRTFTDELASAAVRKRQLEIGLSQALALDELELVYQPQISMQSGKVTGIEALLRWRSAELGLVMPNEFIALAEENGLIMSIGEWMLRTACCEAKRLQLELGRDLTLAVNMSPRQVLQDSLPLLICCILAESELNASSLELEITENVLLSNSPQGLGILEEVRSLGVRVAIDDFGTGFSSMSYILRFRVDRLKIDQSFIREIITDSDSRAVTTAVIALAKALNIPVVAEGVETKELRDFLLNEGCNDAQGYFYSMPVPITDIPAVIRSIECAQLPEQYIEP